MVFIYVEPLQFADSNTEKQFSPRDPICLSPAFISFNNELSNVCESRVSML